MMLYEQKMDGILKQSKLDTPPRNTALELFHVGPIHWTYSFLGPLLISIDDILY
jgi:hypothetical protein